MIRDSSNGFGLVSILFHWVSAIATLSLFGLGVYLTSYGYYSQHALKIAHFHYALGVLLFLLVAVRLVWRLTSKNPVPLAKSLMGRTTIKLIKFLLYVFLFVIMVTGYLLCTSEGQSINVFGLFEAKSYVMLNVEQLNIAGLTHKYLSWVLFGVVIIHATAALFHQFVIKDRTLARMIKPARKTD